MNIIEHNKNGLVYLTADGFEAAGGVAHGFSTRAGYRRGSTPPSTWA